MKIKQLIYLFILCLFLLFSFSKASIGIINTKHNLSISGLGNIKSTEEREICVFCHTPHNAYPDYPLWGHEITAVTYYTHYTSDTLKSYSSEADAPPIDGVSRLCLSCHDGTVAIGAIITKKGKIEMVNIEDIIELGRLRPGASGYLGTDLSGGHPISIKFDAILANIRNADPYLIHLNWPIIDRDVKLYPTQDGYGVQCSSCHDPHGGKGGIDAPPLWRKTTYDEVCLVCHTLSTIIGH